MTEADWVFAERISPQLFIGSGFVFLFILPMIGATLQAGLTPISLYEVILMALLVFWVGLTTFVLELRCPKAVRSTPSTLEVKTRFGRVVRIPREKAELSTSWPDRWGSLKRPGRSPAMFLTPRQYDALFAVLVEPHSELHARMSAA
jgi:hypothetical protein